MERLLMLGCGSMGSSLLTSFIQSGCFEIDVADRSNRDKPSQISKNFPSVASLPDLNYDYIMLAVKPQGLDALVREMKSKGIACHRDTTVISILAGVTSSTIQSKLGFLGEKIQVIRAMPNLPVMVGRGVTMIYAPNTPKEKLERFLSYTGRTIYVSKESYIDDFTALCGSGTGYIFLLMQTLLEASREVLSPDFLQGGESGMLHSIILDTFIGACKLAEASPQHAFEDLKKKVTSKGGTTYAGLCELDREGALKELFRKTLVAAKNRSVELSQQD